MTSMILAAAFVLQSPGFRSGQSAPGAAAKRPGFVVQEDVVVEHAGTSISGTQTTEIDGQHIRREASSRPGEAVLVDAADPVHALVLLDANRQTVAALTREEIARADMPGPMMEGLGVQAGLASAPVAVDTPFKATGRTMLIGGRKTAEFVSTVPGLAGMTTTLWLADRPMGIPNQALVSVLAKVYSRPGSRWVPYFSAMKGLPGFPLRTILRYRQDGAETVVTLTVRSIVNIPLDPARFSIPPGYQPSKEDLLSTEQ